ncbi:hypothetical protein CRUP_017315 [Coryphaenoides rupestris]|nr:hypothetical protein CRUP_017315 [Coryphaenoides rupestris]
MRGGAAAATLNAAIPSGEWLPGRGGGPGRGLTGLRGLSGLGVPGVPGVPGVLGVLWGLGDSEEQVVAAEEVVLVEEVEVEPGPFFTCSRVSRTTVSGSRAREERKVSVKLCCPLLERRRGVSSTPRRSESCRLTSCSAAPFLKESSRAERPA